MNIFREGDCGGVVNPSLARGIVRASLDNNAE